MQFVKLLSVFLISAVAVPASGQSDEGAPVIEFFTASHSELPRFDQVAMFWKIEGDYERAEIFNLHCQSRDVTGRESYLTPPLNQLGNHPMVLVVTDESGRATSQSLIVRVTNAESPSVSVITEWTQLTATTGMLRFDVYSSDDVLASWEMSAYGTAVVFAPESGLLPHGSGHIEVEYEVLEPFEQDYVTLEFALTPSGGVQQVDILSINLRPVQTKPLALTRIAFSAVNHEEGATRSGTLRFTVENPRSEVEWSVEIIGGDENGLLNGTPKQTSGVLEPNGLRSVWCHYQADRESSDPVLFLIQAKELGLEDGTMDAMVFKLD